MPLAPIIPISLAAGVALAAQPRVRPGYRRRVIDEKLVPLEFALGRTFKRPSFLELALTHASAGFGVSNERLEFLGDREIGLVVAEWMYRRYEELDEHELTKLFGWVTSREVEAKRARRLLLGKFARLGKSLDPDNLPESVLANLYEAIVGALYLDGGAAPARKFVISDLIPELHGHSDSNFKTQLQLVLQAQGRQPGFRTLGRSGTDDNPEWAVKVVAIPGGETLGLGKGKNKQQAEQAAARMALEKLRLPATAAA